MKQCKNTDKHIWRLDENDPYSPSIHVTENGHIGINVGGTVIVKPIKDWHILGMKEAHPLITLKSE